MEPNTETFYQLVPKKHTTKLRLNRVKDNAIIFRHGHIAITNYELGQNREFEKSISTWEEMQWRYDRKVGYYVPELKEFRIPRGFNTEQLAQYFKGYNVRVDNNAVYPADKIKIDLLTPPRDDEQRVGLSFLCCQGEFTRNARYTTLMLDLTTGSGKSYTAVAATCFMQARTLIVVPFSKLLDQWKMSYLNFTSLKEDEILIVQGSKTCEKIIAGEYTHIKVFIMMCDTLDSFNKRHGDLETIELLRSTNAYVKIIDEVHRDLKIISKIEALSNFHMNFYLSATPGRTQRKENWIFKTCFYHVPKFGSKFKTKEEKHLNVIVKRYSFVPTPAQISRMVHRQKKWLNGKSYEKELMYAPDEQKADFVNSLKAMLKWSKGLLKDGNKILILSETIDGTEFTRHIADEIFPNKCARYYGQMKDADKEEALKATVICATISSLGTGADMPGIQHVYNITTYSSQITAIQTAGRGRKLKDGVSVFYIELVNLSYLKTLRQYEKRKPNLIKISKTGKIMVID